MDTARQLDWLKRVKESHGSVELNALASAQAINDRGIYTVGNCALIAAGKKVIKKCMSPVVLG